MQSACLVRPRLLHLPSQVAFARGARRMIASETVRCYQTSQPVPNSAKFPEALRLRIGSPSPILLDCHALKLEIRPQQPYTSRSLSRNQRLTRLDTLIFFKRHSTLRRLYTELLSPLPDLSEQRTTRNCCVSGLGLPNVD